MTQKEIDMKVTDMLGHLEAACNAAFALMRLGVMSKATYNNLFNNKIAIMENELREIYDGVE